MSKLMKEYGGLILFYGIIILGVIMLNERFRYLNNEMLTTPMMEQEVLLKN